MIRPTVSQVHSWRPETLAGLADHWAAGASQLRALLDDGLPGAAGSWSGPAARAADNHAARIAADGAALLARIDEGCAALRAGAAQLADARADVLLLVAQARAAGHPPGEDGTVTSDAALTAALRVALDRAGAVDSDAARCVDAAFESVQPGTGSPREWAGQAWVARGAATVPAGIAPENLSALVATWPGTGQAGIAAGVAALTDADRNRLVQLFPAQVGNTDGIPWEMRVAANRLNIAAAAESDPVRAAFYRTLLHDVEDPARSGRRVSRQILAFDPARAALIELHGDLAKASSVAVLVPGLNTTVEGSAAQVSTARRFVGATRGDVAMITYLGGAFPHGNPLTGLADAADPGYALAMAPRLVAFSEDVDRRADAAAAAAGTGPIPVTYIGHSYGGSIVGTAEALGLTSDRTLFVAAAGAGVGVHDPSDWHNRNPAVLRFSMTAPGDFIEAVQGLPGGPHGADPDELAGVVGLDTGYYDDGRLMAGWDAHSDVLNWPSDSWRNILAVITGDSATLHRTR